MRLVRLTGLVVVAIFTSDPASKTVNSYGLLQGGGGSTNVALASAGGVATASANTSTQALVNDGNTATQGWVVSTTASTIKVDWGSPKTINEVTAIFANSNSKTFKFQYWNGSGWADLSLTYISNTAPTVTYPLPSPITTVAVRLNFSSGASGVYVNELQAFATTSSTNVALASAGGVATASANTSTQALVNDGNTTTQGWVVSTTASTIKVDWFSIKTINEVTAIFANSNSKTFKFQYWNGSGWVDLSTFYTGNTAPIVTLPLTSPVATNAVRLNFSSAVSGVYVNELQAFAEPPGSHLRVVEWNLGKLTYGTAAQHATRLAAQNADLILATEVAGQTHANDIVAGLGADWATIYHGGSTEGVAIFYKLSRLELEGTAYKFDIGPSSWSGVREAIRAQFTMGDATFYAFVTHLDWPQDENWNGPNEEHVQNRNEFVAELDLAGGAMIFGGDLNAWYYGANSVQQATIAAFDGRGVDSCFVEVTNPADDTLAEKHTYCDNNFKTRNNRLDHIYATSDFIPVSHNVVDDGGDSDHRLVVAEFDIE
jgi:endonuclease/exonuclease/phosphatase (EEP) superfamily protein YafD